MGNEFFFVDGFKPDRATKKSLRSHVMKGKNVGKTLNRPSKLSLSTNSRPHTSTSPVHANPVLHHETSHEEQDPDIGMRITASRHVGNAFLTCSLPVELTPPYLKIINQFFTYVVDKMYPLRLGLSAEEAKYTYLRVMFTDETVAFCSISLMDACNEFFLGGNATSPTGLQHLSRALKLISKRLEADDALSDSTMWLVIYLILQEEIRDEREAAEIHFNGLKMMVEARGGLEQLEGNKHLLLKICKMNICYTLRHGGTIDFYRDSTSQPQLVTRPPHAAGPSPHHAIDPCLYEVLFNINEMSIQLNHRPGRPIYDMLTLQDIVVSLSCRLIRYQPLGVRWTCSITDAAYHIGLLIFMMTIFLQHDHRRVWQYPLVIRRFQEVVLACEQLDEEKRTDDLLLWVMFVGGIWILAEADGYWMLPKLRDLTERLGIKTFAGVLSRISNFPWINALHDESGQAIFELMETELQLEI